MFFKLKATLAAVMGLSVLVSFCCCDAEARPATQHSCCEKTPLPVHGKESCPSCPHQNLNARLLDKTPPVSFKVDQTPSSVSYLDHPDLTSFDFSAVKNDSYLVRLTEGSPPVDLNIVYLVLRP